MYQLIHLMMLGCALIILLLLSCTLLAILRSRTYMEELMK